MRFAVGEHVVDGRTVQAGAGLEQRALQHVQRQDHVAAQVAAPREEVVHRAHALLRT
jgi:hypothetical protein